MSFWVTKDSNIQKSALQFLLNENRNGELAETNETFGGILSNLNYAWLVSGSRLVVVNYKNGARVGIWDFGITLQDDTSDIVGVDEIQRPHGKEPLLAISINCDTSGGIICIFDFVGSKVIRAIQIVEQISSLHVIDGGQDVFKLSGPLRNFDGIFAVGTLSGNVYIVDICRQLCYEGFGTLNARDGLNPYTIKVVTSHDLLDIENHKKNALRNESHLAIYLNAVHDNTTEHFVLKAPNGEDKVHVNKQEVLISALHYCRQLGSILVGYNFGAFQLWNLMTMELIYTSPICEEHVPISMFALQEPADDPRAFCYVWAVYSSDDLNLPLLPYLVMYALCYESKEFDESHGILYENFQYCAVRFHMELGFNNESVVDPKGGKCLRLQSFVHKNSINSETHMLDATEDVLSLCVVIWKAVCDNGQFTYMALFDLNQWYKAQMPNSLNFDDCTKYMMITLCATDLTSSGPDNAEGKAQVFDVALNKKTIQQFVGTQRLEEHYHPFSLSFDTCCLLENRCVTIRYQGVQKALLSQLQSAGPLCLIRPTEIYQEIVSLGLTPLFVDISPSSPSILSLNLQREVILNVALEQQVMGWLCKCATEWANGSFSSTGCSLELLTSWAYRRGIVLKSNCDQLCVPLFDYSEDWLDTNDTNKLNVCIRQIKDLLAEQCHNLKMIEVYFDVLQWLLNVGLLPEYAPSRLESVNHEAKIRAPYPADELTDYYEQRRSELLLSLKRCFDSRSSVLFIDNLISIECEGDELVRDWKEVGGDGFYPPRSLQALLRTYLTDGIEVSNKHAVVIYLFLDLARVLDPQKYTSVITHLIKFPAVFKVSPSLIKITQAFWQLDHGDLSTAMEQLLDPLVNQEDLKYWHHKVALKSLLVQDQPNSALLYMHVRKPPILDDEDVLCALSLFVSNNMLDEAFYLEKNYKTCLGSEKFMRHLFAECSRHGVMNKIIYRNLSEEEEKLFLRYLDEIKHPEAADLKITYYMQRSHYIEAFRTYAKFENDPMKKGLVSRSNSKVRDQMIHSYQKLLPTVSYKFIENCTKDQNPTVWKEVSRPEPMSVCVHETNEKTEYKSSFIFAALAKAKQTFNGGFNNLSSLLNATTEEIPFLRTPTLLPSRKRPSVQIIVPKIVEEDDGPSPEKRARRNSRSASLLSQSSINMDSSILNTPIVTKKNRSRTSPMERSSKDYTLTPTSILKNVSLLSGRKPIPRISSVRFDVPSSSSEEQYSPSISRSSLSPHNREARTLNATESLSVQSTKSFSRSITPIHLSDSEDVFYSPNSSLNNIEDIPKDEEQSAPQYNSNHFTPERSIDSDDRKGEDDLHKMDGEFIKASLRLNPTKTANISEAKLIKLVDYDPSTSSTTDDTEASTRGSPRARKSYKKTSTVQVPMRSSPRLNRSRKLSGSDTPSSSEKSTASNRERGGCDIPDVSTASSENDEFVIKELPLNSKIKSRKSLSRQVLENNAFSRLNAEVDSAHTTYALVHSPQTSEDNVDVSQTSQVQVDRPQAFLVRADSPEASQVQIDSSHTPVSPRTSRTTVFHSEAEKMSSVSVHKEISECAYTKIEYSDVYKADPSIPNAFTEQHSMMLSSSSVRETVMDSDNNSSTRSSTDALPINSPVLSDSMMQELVDDLRKRTKREIAVYQQEIVQDNSKSARRPTPERIARSLRRMSSERADLLSDNQPTNTSKSDKQTEISNFSDTLKPRRLSADTDATSSDSSNTKQEDKIPLLQFIPKIKSRKSLSRKVVDSNVMSKLTVESPSNIDPVENVCNEEKNESVPLLQSAVDSSTPKDPENRLSLSDSLLEMIAFGKLSYEKELLENRAILLQQKEEEQDCTLSKKDESSVEQAPNAALPEFDKKSSDSLEIRESKNENENEWKLVGKAEDSLLNVADITDDLDPDDSLPPFETAILLSRSHNSEKVRSECDPQFVTVNVEVVEELQLAGENNENENEIESTIGNAEVYFGADSIPEEELEISPGRDAMDNRPQEYEDFSMVYENLSNHDEFEMNIFEISNDSNSNKGIAQGEGSEGSNVDKEHKISISSGAGDSNEEEIKSGGTLGQNDSSPKENEEVEKRSIELQTGKSLMDLTRSDKETSTDEVGLKVEAGESDLDTQLLGEIKKHSTCSVTTNAPVVSGKLPPVPDSNKTEIQEVFETNLMYSESSNSDEGALEIDEENNFPKPAVLTEVIDIASSSDDVESKSSTSTKDSIVSNGCSNNSEKTSNSEASVKHCEGEVSDEIRSVRKDDGSCIGTPKKLTKSVTAKIGVASPSRRMTRRTSKLLEENEIDSGTEGEVEMLEPSKDDHTNLNEGKVNLDELNRGNPSEDGTKSPDEAEIFEQIENKSVEIQTGKSLLGTTKADQENDSQMEETEKKSEQSGIDVEKTVTPSRRLTRRSSKLLEESENDSTNSKRSEEIEPDLDVPKIDIQETLTMKKSHRSRLSIDPASPSQITLQVKLPELSSKSSNLRTYTRKRTRSVDTPILEMSEVDDESDTALSNVPICTTRTRLRSASVDCVIDPQEVPSENNVRRPSSVIEGGTKTKRKPEVVLKRNTIETYALTRRLTRRQANIMTSTLKETDEQVVDEDAAEPHFRIELLDKPTYEGVADPEEQKVYETSPTSSGSSASASVTGRRTRRLSSSNASEHSNASSALSTPKKTRTSVRHSDSPIVIENRRRLRSASVEDGTDDVKKSRRTKKKVAEDDESVTSNISSVTSKSKKSSSSKKSNASRSSSRSNKKRTVIAKSHLPGIEEENLGQNTEVSERARRRK